MSTEILLMPAGGGKTEAALQRLVHTAQHQPFSKIWVLVSGRRQEDAFRQRLIERGGRRVYFNVEFFTFYQLYHRLLNIARQPPRRLDDAGRYGLVRAMIARLHQAGELQVYDSIAATPGFVRVVADFIYELKQNIVRPEVFEALAVSAKDKDLARIYSRYQAALQDKGRDLVDREGEGWLALALLSEAQEYQNIGRDVDLLLVDGYDQFTRLQAELLMLLAGRARQALITLTTVPDREATVGQRFAETLAQLQRAAGEQALTIVEQPAAPPAVGRRHPDLRHLCDEIFHNHPQTHAAGEGVRFIEAPDIGREVGALLRQVKRLLLAGDCSPDDILIALRDWPRYAGQVAAYGRRYGIPLALHGGEPLAHNPAVIALLNLLNLHTTDFRRRDLLDTLRSAYFAVPGLGAAQVDLLEQVSRAFVVVGGRAQWLDALERAALASAPDVEEDEQQTALLSAEAAAELSEHLNAFFEAVTPPAQASMGEYVRWLDALIGVDEETDPDEPSLPPAQVYHLHMPGCIRGFEETSPRDLVALNQLKRALRSMLSAEELLVALNEARVMTRQHFLTELQTAVNAASVNPAPRRDGQVLVTTVTDARGLPHKHVFIPGLAEGVFPASAPEDPLYLDSERRKLNERGILIERQAGRMAEDGLFYELLSLAGESLTLSRPTVRDGAPWVASHLWREAVRVFGNSGEVTERITVGAVVSAAEAASPHEALVAAAEALCEPQTGEGWLYNWLLAQQGELWARIRSARRMELERASYKSRHDRYTGRLSQPELIAYVAAELGPQRVWSASQLNDYGVCGFRFFAKRLLKLEALEEPEDGLDARKLGTVNHEILERTYREIGQRGLTITPENLDEALVILDEQAADVLEHAPRRLGFKANALWQQERDSLLRRLRGLVRQDFLSNPVAKLTAAPRRPYMLEAEFNNTAIPIEVDGRAEALRVRGFIDRIDHSPDGAVIIDYKTGSTEIPASEMAEGRNFQMMVYLRAAEQVLANMAGFDAPLLGGLFWHIRSQKVSGRLPMNDVEGQENLRRAEQHIGRYIAAGRRGDFTVHPGKPDKGRCTHYCEYAKLCRTSGTSRYKPDKR